MTYAYCRCSSPKSTIENQIFEIKKFAEQNEIKIDRWVTETVSGAKTYRKRKLGKLLGRLKPCDMIICSEISRLGRSLFQIMEILNIAMGAEAKLWTIKDNFRLGDDIQSKVLAFAFGISAEIERKLISQRTKEALARKREEGVKLGRPYGSKNKQRKLDPYEKYIYRSLRKRRTKESIIRHIHCSRTTLNKWLLERDSKNSTCSHQ